MTHVRALIMTLLLIVLASSAQAQDPAVIVPDLRGLSVPAAAAALNTVGLRLGTVTPARWLPESGLPQNTVGDQTPAAATTHTPGADVAVTVLRVPNVLLIYDDNDLTFVNQTSAPLPLAGIAFASADGIARFDAARWPGGLLAVGDCGQIWSVPRGEPKPWDECPESTYWLTTSSTAEHFWTALNRVTAFSLVQNGEVRVTCPAAPAAAEPLRCEAYLPAPTQAEETPFIYFAYTEDRLVIANPTPDQWMPLAAARVANFNPNLAVPGAEIPVGDPALYGSPPIVADIARLAPGQCLLFTRGSLAAPTPPTPCQAIAILGIDPALIFWSASFEIVSISDDQRRACPAAAAGKTTICILPR